MNLLGIVIVAIIRVNAVHPSSGKSQSHIIITTSLLNYVCLLVCSVFFDQMAVTFAAVPIGLSIFLVSSGPDKKHAILLNNSAPHSRVNQYLPNSDRGRNVRSVISLFLAVLLAGILLPIASSSFNLLYMNLLPLVLSILPSVFAGGIVWGLYLLWLKFHKRPFSIDPTTGFNPATSPFSSTVRNLQYWSLILEGSVTLVVILNGSHLLGSFFAGVFVILFLVTIQSLVSEKIQNHKESNVYYLLFGVVLMLGAGTFLHAIKGSLIYSIASPVPYDVVVVINLVILAGCLALTVVGLLLTQKDKRPHHTFRLED